MRIYQRSRVFSLLVEPYDGDILVSRLDSGAFDFIDQFCYKIHFCPGFDSHAHIILTTRIPITPAMLLEFIGVDGYCDSVSCGYKRLRDWLSRHTHDFM